MKQFFLLMCTVMVLTCLSACQSLQAFAPEIPAESTSSAPMRMVDQVKAMLRSDPASSRTYQLQQTLNPLMHLLREMDYDKPVYNDDGLERCESYFSFSVHYASGERQNYRLLAHQYLKVGSERWYEISRDDALALTQFLMEHESDTVFHLNEDSLTPVSFHETSAAK